MIAVKRRILLVDDHSMLREGLRAIIDATDELEVCGEAESGEQCMNLLPQANPDLLVVDISLKNKIDGIELTKRIKQRYPSLPVLVLSMHEEEKYVSNAFAAGARGYITKTEGGNRFLLAIRQVLDGKKYVSDALR